MGDMIKSGKIEGLGGVSNRPKEGVSSFSCINLTRKRSDMPPSSPDPSTREPLLPVTPKRDSSIYGCFSNGLFPECPRVTTASNHPEVLWSVIPTTPVDMVNLVGFLKVAEKRLGDNSVNGDHLPSQSGMHIYKTSLASKGSDPLVGCSSISLFYGAIGKSDNPNSVKINSYTIGNISHAAILAN